MSKGSGWLRPALTIGSAARRLAEPFRPEMFHYATPPSGYTGDVPVSPV